MEDLGGSDILVLDGDALGSCGLGIESTVAKIDVENNQILILRMGGVTQDRIREVLKEGGGDFSGIRVFAGSVAGGKTEVEVESKQEGGHTASSRKEPAEAEGQAPGETFLLIAVFVQAQRRLRQQFTELACQRYDPPWRKILHGFMMHFVVRVGCRRCALYLHAAVPRLGSQ